MAGGVEMQALADLPQVWTFEDWQRIPDEQWRRCEIVDGALVVSPAAGVDHEYVLDMLRALLRPQLPPALWVSGSLGVDLEPSYRIPDLLIFPRNLIGAGRNLLQPHELSLAVEVVSPSSRTTDRVTKPAEYASAGIPSYWRVDTQPSVVLTAHRIPADGAMYVEVGSWGEGETVELDHPFPVRFDIDDLVPRPGGIRP